MRATMILLLALASCAAPAGAPLPCGSEPLTVIETGEGPEDMALVPLGGGRHRLFVRVKNGIEISTLTAEGGVEDRQKLACTGFDPLGLSFRGDADGGELFIIDRSAHAVRRLAPVDATVSNAELAAGRCPPEAAFAADDELPAPNDLLAVPGGKDVYVSNPDLVWFRSWLGRWPSVVLWQGRGEPRPVVTELDFANGMVATPDGRHLLVADYRAKRLVAYRRQDDGALRPLCRIKLDAAPDNLTSDGSGRVLVAAQDSVVRSGLHLLLSLLPILNPAGSPSRVYEIDLGRLDLAGLVPGDATRSCGGPAPSTIWTDGGRHVVAGSTAVRVGDRLLVSQIVQPGVFVFRCEGSWAAGGD